MKDNYYFKKYGIDVSCEIESLFEISDTEKLNAIKMLLDNLEEWWGAYINCKQEEIEYNKLKEVIEKLDDLVKIREDYIDEWKAKEVEDYE